MDGTRFDRLTKQFASRRSRRAVLIGLATGLAGAVVDSLGLRTAPALAAPPPCSRYDHAAGDDTSPRRAPEAASSIAMRALTERQLRKLDAAVRALGFGGGSPHAFELVDGA